ncbi:MAG: T9SS type A sorting domain-containing protein [Bacteroidota bacterium]
MKKIELVLTFIVVLCVCQSARAQNILLQQWNTIGSFPYLQSTPTPLGNWTTIGSWSIESALTSVTPNCNTGIPSSPNIVKFSNETNIPISNNLITPPLNLSLYPGTSMKVSFWMYHNPGAATNDRMQIYANTVPDNVGGTPTLLGTFNRISGTLSGWSKDSIYIPPTYTGTTYIIFRGVSGASSTTQGNNMYLDDISISDTGSLSPCHPPLAQPTSLYFSAIDATTATVNFTPATPLPTGYLIVASNGPLLGTPDSGSIYTIGSICGNGTVVAVGAAPPFHLNSLTSATAYNITVFPYNTTLCLGIAYDTIAPISNTFTTLSQIPVKFYLDANNDCIHNASEGFVPQSFLTEIDSNGVAIDTISSLGSGFNYYPHGILGTVYTFKILSMPGNLEHTCPVSGVLVNTLTVNNPTLYFGMSCGPGTDFDLSVNATVPVSGIHDQWGDIYVSNSYCVSTNAVLTLHYSPKYAVIPTQITLPGVATGNSTITWNLSNLSSSSTPAQLSLHYVLWAPIAALLTPGDTVQSYFCITPYGGDVDTLNNVKIRVDTIKASCDPNEMWVSPDSHVLTCDTLTYTVQFMNTGNDTAHHIVVLDTISNNLDINSLNMVMSSSDVVVSKQFNGSNWVLKFDFDNINLLDSSHKDACTGMFIFKIKPKTTVSVGTIITNEAGIYFDDNSVVMTDQVTTIIENVCPTPTYITTVKEHPATISIYPNPAATTVHIASSEKVNVRVTGIDGNLLIEQHNIQDLNISSLANGLYFISLYNPSTGQRIQTSQLVKTGE